MSLVSSLFLAFVAAVVLLYYILPRSCRFWVILAASLAFSAFLGFYTLLFVLISAVLCYIGGLLAGALVTGVLLAIFMSNSGGAWDNAKKYIEGGNFGGKGSESHHAAVVGDTVGDPFKDTSGPSINILIKLMTVVSLVFAPLFLSIGSLL